MQNEEKKGITVKVSASLHAEVKEYLEERGITMSEFVETALQDELHPKNQISEEKDMENMRTMAFQVPDSLFQRIKEYLQRNNISQKQFVLGLIQTELDREQTARQAESPCNEQDEERAEGQGKSPAEREFWGVEGALGDGNEAANDEQTECEEQTKGEAGYGETPLADGEPKIAAPGDENETECMSMSM